MEEGVDAPCVVYFCGNAHDELCKLFSDDSPPPSAALGHPDPALDRVYRNVRVLLDENLGGFREGTGCGPTT